MEALTNLIAPPPREPADPIRDQCEDAIRVLDAIIARDAACDAYRDRMLAIEKTGQRMTAEQRDGVMRLFRAHKEAQEHAQHQVEVYRARYGHTR